jgi:SynChlorMet cassette protein ScmC
MGVTHHAHDMMPDSGIISHVLTLSDGYAWNLWASQGTREWLEEFARVLKLPPGSRSGIPNIIFVRGAVGGRWFGQPAGRPEMHLLSGPQSGTWLMRDLAVMRLWYRPHSPDCIAELLNTRKRSIELLMMWQALHPVFDAVMKDRGMPLHAALVAHEGRGVLLAGTGGSGKTTCCCRLPSRWQVLGDDETLLVRTSEGRYIAHPLPTWNDLLVRELDHSWDVSTHVRLDAIFFIHQAESDAMDPMGRGEAATRICHSSEQVCLRQTQTLQNHELKAWRRRMFANACDLATAVPVFGLRISRFGEFWQHMEDALDHLP